MIRWKYLVSVVLAAIVLPTGSVAFDPSHVERLKTANSCFACDLRNADLSGWLLAGADLASARLEGANLNGADLTNADLRDTNVYITNLKNSDLTGAKINEDSFGGALLRGTIMPDGMVHE